MFSFTAAKKELLPNASARRIFGLISDDLKLVESEFERQASSNIQVIDYLGQYIRQSGGKRVRPALLILSNRAVGGVARTPEVIRLATVMEMLHTATLVHDDILDNADVRRNRPSINARFGNQTAVLMGDWLYMSAFEASLKERSLELLDILTRLTRRMTEGELIQMTLVGRLDISEREYFDILRRKTAYLFSACCEIGGILGGAKPSEQGALRDYGLNLGIAFQMLDDILDLTSVEEELGKAAGSDLLEGKLTLPLILLLQAEPQLKELMRGIMLAGEYVGHSRETIQEKCAARGVIAQVREMAETYCRQARKSLDILPQSEYRLRLADVLSFVIERNS